jgi:hypothetical protein
MNQSDVVTVLMKFMSSLLINNSFAFKMSVVVFVNYNEKTEKAKQKNLTDLLIPGGKTGPVGSIERQNINVTPGNHL